MSSSRTRILERLGQLPQKGLEKPEIDIQGITFSDPIQKYAETLPTVGGTAVILNDINELPHALDTAFPQAKEICSWPSDVYKSTVQLESLEKPHDLESLDLMVCKGHFGVAENAAVWVKLPDLRYRVSLIIAEHLAIVVKKEDILNNMHEAYERKEMNFDQSGYGVFLSGPSKTADIEQCLVIGAHGPKSCTVFIV